MQDIRGNNSLYFDIERLLANIQTDFGGGCSLKKAYMMAWIIRKYNLQTTVDIGVYRGRSFFPQALTHHKFTGGCVYGIDPYTQEDAEQNDIPELKNQFDEFFKKTDFQIIYKDAMSLISYFNYNSNAVLIRERADTAIHFFIKNNIKINLIHIDGNHDTKNVMMDVKLYSEILSKRGFIVIDDISWKSVRPAYNFLLQKYSLVYEQTDSHDDYALFSNSKSILERWMLRRILKNISKYLKDF